MTDTLTLTKETLRPFKLNKGTAQRLLAALASGNGETLNLRQIAGGQQGEAKKLLQVPGLQFIDDLCVIGAPPHRDFGEEVEGTYLALLQAATEGLPKIDIFWTTLRAAGLPSSYSGLVSYLDGSFRTHAKEADPKSDIVVDNLLKHLPKIISNEVVEASAPAMSAQIRVTNTIALFQSGKFSMAAAATGSQQASGTIATARKTLRSIYNGFLRQYTAEEEITTEGRYGDATELFHSLLEHHELRLTREVLKYELWLDTIRASKKAEDAVKFYQEGKGDEALETLREGVQILSRVFEESMQGVTRKATSNYWRNKEHAIVVVFEAGSLDRLVDLLDKVGSFRVLPLALQGGDGEFLITERPLEFALRDSLSDSDLVRILLTWEIEEAHKEDGCYADQQGFPFGEEFTAELLNAVPDEGIMSWWNRYRAAYQLRHSRDSQYRQRHYGDLRDKAGITELSVFEGTYLAAVPGFGK